jgi:glycerol-3-phosphate dehydrogenase subunit B
MKYEVIVIGAGVAGLTAAAKAGESGNRVLLISKGLGNVNLSSGCVDVLGYLPKASNYCRTDLEKSLAELAVDYPNHPYNKIGRTNIIESLSYFKKVMATMGYPYQGDCLHNYLLPTVLGLVRPSALIPTTMVPGNILTAANCLLIGIAELVDFSPRLIAGGVNALRTRLKLDGSWQSGGSITLDLTGKKEISPLFLANWLEKPKNLAIFVAKLKKLLVKHNQMKLTRIGVPAILGADYRTNHEIYEHIQAALGCQLFEIPVGQPTVPGHRLASLLADYVKKIGVQIHLGLAVLKVSSNNLNSIQVEAASSGRQLSYACNNLVLATGGFLGRGLTLDSGRVVETIVGLPVEGGANIGSQIFAEELVQRGYQPYSLLGITVDGKMRPQLPGESNKINNIFVVGRNLAGYDPIVEKSGLGVAISSGFVAGKALAKREERNETGSDRCLG